jgi:predicted GNAT family acetyltransferase
VRIVVTRDVEEFGSRAGGLLESRLECNVLATVFMNVRSGGYAAEHPTFAYGVDARGESTAAAMRVPPWPMLATGFADPLGARTLVERWLPEDPEVNAVTAEPPVARAVAGALATLTGRRHTLRVSEAMHVLESVSPLPAPAGGAFRTAERRDRDVLIDWDRAFAAEAGVGFASEAERLVDRRLAAGSQFVWDDDGPVATAGLNPAVAGTARIGPVYTPPAHRRNGYATSLVTALSAHALRSGAARCMLFTDLANPTSNKIYARIGYRRHGDWEERVVEP